MIFAVRPVVGHSMTSLVWSQLHRTARAPGGEDGPVRDDQLRLIFTCCHPALRTEHAVALTLRLLGGLSVEEVARSFLVSEAAMAKRLVRAK
jgi:RNA polymerase sigma-70 factor, ECF subfamily